MAVDQSASMTGPVPSFPATIASAARRVGRLPETRIALPFAAFVSIVSILIGVPIVLPSPSSLSFVGFHYLIPIATILGASLIFARDRQAGLRLVYMLGIYTAVLILHFNLKLWIPLINPRVFDPLYMHLDSMVRGVVDLCMALHVHAESVVPSFNHFYLYGFVGSFYLTFFYFAFVKSHAFEEVFVGAVMFQVLGSLAYLLMPAYGPFVYEQGANALTTGVQHWMLGVHRSVAGGGGGWIAVQGSERLLAGIAAMPSLHAGGMFLFLIYALKWSRPLAAVLAVVFVIICIEAIATRWHYVIDLPVGMGVAVLAAYLVRKLLSAQTQDARANRARAACT